MQKIWVRNSVLILCLLLLVIEHLAAQDRFPKPEFETDYEQPLTTTPKPRTAFYEIFDIIVLVSALSLASYFALKKRSRRGIFWLTIFSVIYFGFIREGCVCAVGSIQNISLALADTSFIIPVTVILFFALPLLFTLFFGRTFCAAVCPLGAIQDIVILRPAKLPAWASQVLGLLPYLYLGLAVLFAATGSAFIICRYDPFVSIFRLGANFNMIVYSAAFLLLSVFIARPYCRFLCPYGVLLSWMSRLSRRRVKTTPDTCVQCRLCEDACPFDAIRKPTLEKAPESREQGIRRLAILIVLLPIIMATFGWSVAQLHQVLARVHPFVDLAEQIKIEDAGISKETTLESKTFRATGTTSRELFNKSITIRKRFYTGGWILGGFIGLVFALKLIGLSVRRTRTDYEPDRAACFSCARCFSYCPKEHVRLKNNKSNEPHYKKKSCF